jgi:predicted ATPase
MVKRNNIYIITGGVGFGKTSLVKELCKGGRYGEILELAAELIEEQLKIGGNLIPWIDRFAFEQELLKRKIYAFLHASSEKIIFSDRGIPDAIPFLRAENKSIPDDILEACENYRYNPKVFIVPPWKEIYVNRPTRPQTFEESLKLGKALIEAYEEFGYETIEVPKANIKKRANFVIKCL